MAAGADRGRGHRGRALLTAAGIATGHIVMAVVGGAILLAAGNACVQVARARRGRREPGPQNDAENDPENDTVER